MTVSELFARSHDGLLARLRSRFGPDTAEDALAEAWSKVALYPAGDPRIHPAWVYRVAHNAAIDALRASRADAVDVVTIDALNEAPGSVGAYLELVEVLAAMRPSQRTVIVEWLAGFKGYEIAARHDYTMGEIASLMRRGRDRAREAGLA